MNQRNLPPGIDINKVSKVDFNKLNQTARPRPQPQPPQQQPQQPPQTPNQFDAPQQAKPQQAPHYTQAQQEQVIPQQQQAKPQNSPEVKKKIAASHPVLIDLLDRFGLKKDKILDNKLYFNEDPSDPVIFTQSDYEESLETWALQEGQFRARLEGEAEGMDWYQTLLASLSVVAINETPLYEIFQIELFDIESQKIAENKYDISERVRKLCANAFAGLLVTKLKGFAEKILEFYVSKLKRENLRSSMDSEKDHHEQFICPEYECTETVFMRPRLDAQGKKLPYFCKLHGTAMEGVIDLGEPKAPSN